MINLPKITKKRALVIIAILIIAGLVIVLRTQDSVDEQDPDLVQATPFPTLSDTLTFEEIPTDPIIEVNGVPVNNFFQGEDPNEAKYVSVVVQTENYSIEYQNRFNKFLIVITGSPFFRTRLLAENDLLETLGIEQEEACELNVDITAPHFAHPDQAGNIYGLSFCSN